MEHLAHSTVGALYTWAGAEQADGMMTPPQQQSGMAPVTLTQASPYPRLRQTAYTARRI